MASQPLNDDEHYFATREQQVREMAAQAADPGVRSIHAELARLYAVRAKQGRHG